MATGLTPSKEKNNVNGHDQAGIQTFPQGALAVLHLFIYLKSLYIKQEKGRKEGRKNASSVDDAVFQHLSSTGTMKIRMRCACLLWRAHISYLPPSIVHIYNIIYRYTTQQWEET